MRIRTCVVLIALLMSMPVADVQSASQTMNYQATLISGGSPVTTTVNVTFRVYAADVGGTPLWTETRTVTPDADGLMSIRLGEASPIVDSVFKSDNTWLGVEVETDGEFVPRTPLAGAPYAHRVATLDGAAGGELNGRLIISEAGAKSLLPPGDATIVLVNASGDSLNMSPLSIAMKDNLGYEQFTVTNDPGQGAVLGIRLDGTESADHSAVTSSWSATAAKSSAAQSTKTQIGSQGMFLYGITDTDTLVTLIEEASGVPELKLTDRNATTATEPQTIQIGGQESGEAVVVSVTDALGNKITETVVDASGSAELIFYDVSAAKANAPSPKKMSFTKDGLLLYGVTDSDTALIILAESGNIFGRGQVAMGQQAGLSVKSSDKSAPSAIWSTVFGFNNTASGDSATVSGGYDNSASGDASTVGGGASHAASALYSTIGGGFNNTASGVSTVVSGGQNNTTSNIGTSIIGGTSNQATGVYSTVGGGSQNIASGPYSFVGGGALNEASGSDAMVPGGRSCTAAGTYSFAAGRNAVANHNGSFVWADEFGGNFTSTAANQFSVQAPGGVRMYSNHSLTTGVTLSAGGGSWSSVSDRNVKENIRPVDGADVLDKVSQLEISRWNYNTQSASIEHIGPMAQDFYELFEVGDNNTSITSVDPDGIALAAIQELHKRNQELESQVAKLTQLVESMAVNQK